MSRQTTKRHVKMTDLFDIKGKIAVMTGSTGVLGKGIASYLASQGCTMLLLCREQSKDKAEAIVEAIREEGGKAAFHVADALDKAALEAVCDSIMNEYGRVDILLNAAGGNMAKANVSPDQTIFDMDIEAMRAVVDLNIFGTLIPTMVFAKGMVEHGGSIVNFCSESTFRKTSFFAKNGFIDS